MHKLSPVVTTHISINLFNMLTATGNKKLTNLFLTETKKFHNITDNGLSMDAMN